MSALQNADAFQHAPQRLHWDPVRFRAVSTRPVAIECEIPPAGDPPEAAAWATQAARASVECLLGLRPSHQLVRWLAPPVYDALVSRVAVTARKKYLARPYTVRVREAIVSEIDARTREASCTVFDGERFRACAMRLREHRGRWLIVALEIG